MHNGKSNKQALWHYDDHTCIAVCTIIIFLNSWMHNVKTITQLTWWPSRNSLNSKELLIIFHHLPSRNLMSFFKPLNNNEEKESWDELLSLLSPIGTPIWNDFFSQNPFVIFLHSIPFSPQFPFPQSKVQAQFYIQELLDLFHGFLSLYHLGFHPFKH